MRCPNATHILVVIVAVLMAPKLADAEATLTLSDLSSDETSADVLAGSLVFDVVGEMLTLTVTNDTSAVSAYDISAIYFNAAPNITELLPAPAISGWDLLVDEKADGFGTFDFALIGQPGGTAARISPAQSLLATFDIIGLAPFIDEGFTTEFSEVPPGETVALAAAKFVSGPNDDSAFGAVVPEPATGLLALFAMALAGCRARRPV